MASPNLPLNQQNALPIPGASASITGTTVIVGGVVTKYFSPSDMGISGVSTTTDGPTGAVYVSSQYLDLRGCSKYAMQVRCVNANIRGALVAMQVVAQYRLSGSDTPAPFYANGGSISLAFNAQLNVLGSGTIIFPATAAISEVQTAYATWETAGGTGQAGEFSVVIGSDVRFFLFFSTNPVAAANAFTCSLWASS